MGVYIKNMTMPQNCDECRIMIYEDTNCMSVHELFCGCPIVFRAHPQHEEHRPDYCPLIEVPPHGRLIDGAKLLDLVQENLREYGEYDAWDVLGDIDDAPTIIEAEEGKT